MNCSTLVRNRAHRGSPYRSRVTIFIARAAASRFMEIARMFLYRHCYCCWLLLFVLSLSFPPPTDQIAQLSLRARESLSLPFRVPRVVLSTIEKTTRPHDIAHQMLVQSAGTICVRARRMCARASERLHDESRAHTHIHTRRVGTETSLHRTHLLDLSHNSSSPFPRRLFTVNVADTARRGHTPKIISSPITSRGATRGRAHDLRRVRVRCTRTSGWAVRRRARTRPVRAIARHTLAHNRTATPFARESALPTIAYNTRLGRGDGPTTRATTHSWQWNAAANASQWRRAPRSPSTASRRGKRPAADAVFLKSRAGWSFEHVVIDCSGSRNRREKAREVWNISMSFLKLLYDEEMGME